MRAKTYPDSQAININLTGWHGYRNSSPPNPIPHETGFIDV